MKRFMMMLMLGIVALAWFWAMPSGLTPPEPSPPTVTVPLPPPVSPFGDRETVDGLPVPIYPGSRVTEAQIQPPQPRPLAPLAYASAPAHPTVVTASSVPSSQHRREVPGRISATEGRATAEARTQLAHEVSAWLTPEVPVSWKPPATLLELMVGRTRIHPVEKNIAGTSYTLYEATLEADFSSGRRSQLVEAYHHELVVRRMTRLAGGLGFILVCLAALSGYIRADEATKGYYTNPLRLVATAGVGASGVLIYQLLA